MNSFRLTESAQQLLEDAAQYLTESGPLEVNKTDILEMAIDDYCKKILKKRG